MTTLPRRAALALPFLALARPAPAAEAGFLAAAADAEGRWRVAAFGADGAKRFESAMPARGHGAAVGPDGGTAVLFARRPGHFALVLDPASGALRQVVERAPGRWFCGHGAFSADGGTLWASEIDATGEGVVGVYAVRRGYARIGEFPTGGADPHDVRLAPDGASIWVANGGIRTDPRLPRTRFELEAFDSSLVRLDTGSGRLLARHRVAQDASLSLRHLALAPDGTVAIAMQHEGPRQDRPPLVALVDAAGLAVLPGPAAGWGLLDHYIGSAAASADGTLFAVTSPRGGAGLVIEAASRRVRAAFTLRDGCGVAAAPGGFLVTSGLGGGVLVAADGTQRRLENPFLAGLRWDNHLVPI